MRIRRLIPALAVLSLLASCQKELGFVEDAENNGNNNPGSNIDIIGTWRFVGIQGVNGNTAEINQGGATTRIEMQLKYKGTNNIGTVTFTNNEMLTNGIGYDMSGTMRTRTYIGGALVNDVSEPIAMNTPATSGSAAYERNSGDSITLTQSPLDYNTGSIVPIGDIQIGGRFRKSNDTLYMRMRTNQAIQSPDPTIPMDMRIDINSEIALVKP